MHPLEVSAVDTLPAVPDYRVNEQQLVVLGPVGAPRVSRTVAVGLEDFLDRVITPQAARRGLTLLLLHARDINPRGTGNTDATVEPPIGTPLESVGKGVAAGGRRAEAIEDDLGRTRGLIAIHRNKEQVRWAHRPDAA